MPSIYAWFSGAERIVNNYFASPNKLFEYFQAGVPVVGSNLPFLRAVIIGSGVGHLFDASDPKSIAMAINAATRNERLKQLRINVLRVRGKYSWDEERKKLVGIFRGLVGGPLAKSRRR
jgi:glycosyltransferase involved in cell wall biosynthesis